MRDLQTLGQIEQDKKNKSRFLDLDLRHITKPQFKTPLDVLKEHLVFHQAEGHSKQIREYEAAIEVLQIAFD